MNSTKICQYIHWIVKQFFFSRLSVTTCMTVVVLPSLHIFSNKIFKILKLESQRIKSNCRVWFLSKNVTCFI